MLLFAVYASFQPGLRYTPGEIQELPVLLWGVNLFAHLSDDGFEVFSSRGRCIARVLCQDEGRFTHIWIEPAELLFKALVIMNEEGENNVFSK